MTEVDLDAVEEITDSRVKHISDGRQVVAAVAKAFCCDAAVSIFAVKK